MHEVKKTKEGDTPREGGGGGGGREGKKKKKKGERNGDNKLDVIACKGRRKRKIKGGEGGEPGTLTMSQHDNRFTCSIFACAGEP